MTHQNHLIYVAFGGSDYRNEVVWSLLSLYLQHPEPDFNIHVFTDVVSEMKAQLPHSVVFHELTADQIQLWKGPQNYPYRVKIKVLQQMLETHSGNFLYLDTDVIVRQSLSPLFASIAQGSVYMDANEGPLHANKGGIARKMKKLLLCWSPLSWLMNSRVPLLAMVPRWLMASSWLMPMPLSEMVMVLAALS